MYKVNVAFTTGSVSGYPGQELDIQDDKLAEDLVGAGYIENIDKNGEGDDPADLDVMKVAELKRFAKDNNIDIGNATKREDILAAILAAQKK